MVFLINDKKTREIIGVFETHVDAELYYLKNNILERLQIAKHTLINSTCLDNIFLIRDLNNVLCDIVEFDSSNCGDNVSGKILNLKQTSYRFFAHNVELELDYRIEYIPDDKYRCLKY